MKTSETLPNSPEKEKEPVELQVNDPMGSLHTWEIEFQCPNEELCRLYNLAIRQVCDEEKLFPFLQTQDKEEGYYAWEMLRDDNANRAYLEGLFSRIHNKVKELLK
ncbi:MAG: hypothetical protein WC242_04455 [Candidatus Paceibacterota bacterium]|jgi:hypothetical protein